MKRLLIEFLVQLVALVVLILVVATVALFMGATTGAVANAVAPDFHIAMADRLGLICPKGETVTIRHDRTVTGVDSHGHPYAGQSNDLYCNSTAEGASRLLDDQQYFNARLTSLGVAVTGYSLLFFVLLFVPLESLALVVLHKVAGGLTKPQPASAAAMPN